MSYSSRILQVFTAFLTLLASDSQAGVVINEFMAASSERRLTYDAFGAPRVGSGIKWCAPGFNDRRWPGGYMPMGYGFSGLSTELSTVMKDKAPSLYLRKEFQVSAVQAASAQTIILSVQFNDGFVAYLNGREVARANCGPTNHYVFAQSPAYNVHANTGILEFSLGWASNWLVPGTNVLAIQAHNAERPSTPSDPSRITQHQPTPEFRINAGLRLQPLAELPAATPIALGGAGGVWKYYVGRAEPSGGVVDPGLLTQTFRAPTGEEDDYDQPSAFVDWVELYNDSATLVDLSGWSLTDDLSVPAKWSFPPNTRLGPGQFLLVLCDGREEANAPAGPATYLHASFKIGDDDGVLALFNAQGVLVDGLTAGYPSQVSFCSYGRVPENPALFAFLPTATPGTNNLAPWLGGRASPPQFVDLENRPFPGGFYSGASLTLKFTNATPEAQMRYTLDGSEPTPFSPLYTAPLVLTQSHERTGIVVRATAFLPGSLPSKTQTHNYLLRRPSLLSTLPALFFTADSGRNFSSPEGLLSIVGGTYNSDIWMANGYETYNFVLANGAPAEREVRLEFYYPPAFYPTNQQPLRTDAGIRTSVSGWSRPRMILSGVASDSPWRADFRQKPSFNIYFGGAFGSGDLDYRFFTNYPVRDFKHLRLRAGKNDIHNPFITDELVRRLWIEMGHQGSRGIFTSLYINGVYRGIFNLCERFREPFFQNHYQSSQEWDVNYIHELVDGDSTALTQLLSVLEQDLSNPFSWRNATNRIDIENTADYFLLNIYCSTWDWPQNNFVMARERSTGPNSRWRFAVWDAEGAFAAVTSQKPVGYNVITQDLIVPPGHGQYYQTLPRIFRRLSTSPEFRLRFADRINRHMFNNGVLDDRDPDGGGPLRSVFIQRLTELIREAGDAIRFNSGSPVNTGSYAAWISPSGRRSYLLGSTPGRQMFRDAGFWPLTEPPQFSQHGGTISSGSSITITSTVATAGQTATLFYTLDGADPRLFGGALNPQALTYSNALHFTRVTTVRARARNDQNGEWSALTEATFAPDPVPASASNLVVAEIMYHPPDATVAELGAGFSDADDFEFIRLLNISSTPVDLRDLRFAGGITFDFSLSQFRYLNPGESVLLVSDLAAFQTRYGTELDSLIAGQYSGNLSNGGEALLLQTAAGEVVRAFEYSDDPPWPTVADGAGNSLILQAPFTNPDHGLASNWQACSMPGGLPAGQPVPVSYARWRELFWELPQTTNSAVAGMEADPDADGIPNFLEYAFGTNPHLPGVRPEPVASLEGLENGPRLSIRMELAAFATEAVHQWESSADLANWTPVTEGLLLESEVPQLSGTVIRKYIEDITLPPGEPRFLRLKISPPEL